MTLSLIPRIHVKKSQGCRLMLAIPGLGGADSRIPVAPISLDFLGDLQANERSYLKKVRWRVGKEWHPRLVTFGLNTYTHQWAQTRIYSHCWQYHSSDVWCSSWLSSAELSLGLTVWLYLRPETNTTWLVPCLQHGAPCPPTSQPPSTEYSESITVAFW